MGFDPGKDYFAVLGVSPDADPAVVKAAYRALAKKYHPDRQPDGTGQSEHKFHELQEAYDVLTDEQRLRQYLHERTLARDKQSAHAARQRRPSVYLQLDDRWDHLLREYPELARHHARLCFVSTKLGRNYKLMILGSRKPAKFGKIAYSMERQFYRRHFSYHRDLQQLARRLALRRRRTAVRELWRDINGRRLLPKRVRQNLLERYESRYLRPRPAAQAGLQPLHLSLPRPRPRPARRPAVHGSQRSPSRFAWLTGLVWG